MVNQLVPLPFNSFRHFQLVPAHSTRVPCFGPQGTSCGSHLLHFLLLPPLTMEVTSLSENQESLHLNAIDQKPGNLHQICFSMQVMPPLLIFSSQLCVSVSVSVSVSICYWSIVVRPSVFPIWQAGLILHWSETKLNLIQIAPISVANPAKRGRDRHCRPELLPPSETQVAFLDH